MALYNSGSVNIVIGSANVRGNSTAFTTYVSSGDLFKDNENNSFYEVGSIVNATNLTLTSRYADASYQTARAENVASANTATTIYSDTLSNTPLIQNYIVITASERFTDNGSGVLAGNASPAGSGTVDYDSGLFSITLGTDLTGSVNLSASYYSGDTRSSMPYKIITDFTPNYDLPELNLNDREFNTIFTKAMRLIDARLYVTASHTLVASDFTQDGGMLVGTGTGGVYQEETGATLLTSLGAENVTLHSSATAGGMSLSSQEIHNQAASDSQNGYVTATYISIIDNKLTNIVEDISPQLGSNLDMNSFNIQTVTPTEMTYVHGVTSAIQTQLSNKLTNIVEDVSPQLGSNLDMNGFNIGGNSEAQLDDAVSTKHTQNTDTALSAQSENLDMNSHKVVSVTDPTSNQDAATKKYVDDSAVSKTVTSKSSDYSVVATDLTSFTAFTNKTATASINFSLDEATTGRMTSFMVRTASYLKCTAGGSDKFEYNGELGVAGGDIRSNTIGSYWAIGCYEASIWTITDLIGTIKYDE